MITWASLETASRIVQFSAPENSLLKSWGNSVCLVRTKVYWVQQDLKAWGSRVYPGPPTLSLLGLNAYHSVHWTQNSPH